MGGAEQIPRISFEEFLSLEGINASKHEWLNGIVYMMAGGTFEHGRLVDNVLVVLRQRLEGRPCRPYSGLGVIVTQTKAAESPHANASLEQR